jgi:hypothetical protein
MSVLLWALLWVVAEAGTAREELIAWASTRRPARGDHPIEEPYAQAWQLWAAVSEVVQRHPDLEVEQIGASLHGTPIWAVHVPAAGAPRRKVLVMAGLHAMEWISTEVALAALQDLVTDRVPGVALTFVVLVNPDGRDKVELDLAAGRNAYRRGNLDNVDLNRDFAVHRERNSVWHGALPGYHATTKAPLSQPETRAIDALAARERYDRAASLHAFGGFFYYPWAGAWGRPQDWGAFVHLGRAMEEAQGARAYKTEQLSRWAFFFRAHGAEIDHLYGRYGTLAFLIELTRSGVDLRKPADLRTYFRWYNPREPARHLEKGVAALRALVEEEIPEQVRADDARRARRPTERRSPG